MRLISVYQLGLDTGEVLQVSKLEATRVARQAGASVTGNRTGRCEQPSAAMRRPAAATASPLPPLPPAPAGPSPLPRNPPGPERGAMGPGPMGGAKAQGPVGAAIVFAPPPRLRLAYFSGSGFHAFTTTAWFLSPHPPPLHNHRLVPRSLPPPSPPSLAREFPKTREFLIFVSALSPLISALFQLLHVYAPFLSFSTSQRRAHMHT